MDVKDLAWSKWYGSNDYTDDFEYVGYVTADAENDAHEYDEIPALGYNRWQIQGYFTDQPTWDCSCEPEGSGNYYALANQAEYEIDAAYDLSGENSNIDFQSEDPANESDVNFSVSIEAGFGPVSVGVSKSIDTYYTNFDDNPHNWAHWTIDCEVFPDAQDDNRGVRFDVEAGGDYRTEKFKALTKFAWNYRYTNDNRENYVFYSDSVSMNHYFDVPVVSV